MKTHPTTISAAMLLLLLLLSACNPYRAVLAPLRHIDPDCYCRYADMARHYYDCQVADYRRAGLPRAQARDSAALSTHRKIAETQLRISEHNRLRFCDCRRLRTRGVFSNPPLLPPQ